MIHNILISLLILLLILVSAFAMYLPFTALVKDRKIGLKYAIPLSFSTEIIIGYILYCTSVMRFFPLSYLSFAILLNIWAYCKLRPIVIPKPKMQWLIVTVGFVLTIIIFFTRYYDAFNFIGPGSNDTFNHLTFVNNLFNPGYLNNGYYAPGFHIVLMPIAKIVSNADLYRFMGPAIGITTVLSFILLVKDKLKNKVLILFFLALLIIPIYNQFTLQTIGFFSSALTFIYFAVFIFLIADQEAKNFKRNLILFLIFSLALALTVPYLFVGVFPAALLIYVMVLIFKKSFAKGYTKFLFIINIILVIGFLASIGHIYIQSKILKRYSGFPGIQVTVDDKVTYNDEIVKESDHVPTFIKNNSFLGPMWGTSYDLLRIKDIRSFNSILGLGAYIWIAFSVFLLIYSLRRKSSLLLTISLMSIFFGLCTQTGIFEMSAYRGRSGWYLLMLSIFGLVIFSDEIYLKKMRLLLLSGCLILSATGLIFPPKFYRSYYDQEFRVLSQIAEQYKDKDLTVIANNHQLGMVAPNITMQKLKPDFLGNPNPVLIIEKLVLRPDPVLSQGAVSTDKNFEDYNKNFEAAQAEIMRSIEGIKQDEYFPNFSKYFENDDFTVYTNIK